MIKSLFFCFCTKTQYSFILNYRGVGQERDEGDLSKWNQREITEISQCVGKVFLVTFSSITIECDWGKFSLQ